CCPPRSPKPPPRRCGCAWVATTKLGHLSCQFILNELSQRHFDQGVAIVDAGQALRLPPQIFDRAACRRSARVLARGALTTEADNLSAQVNVPGFPARGLPSLLLAVPGPC